MGRSQNSFIKKQKEKKRLQKKKEKEEKKKERQENNLKGGDLSDMIAYIDADGNIVSEKPEEIPVKKEPAKKEGEK
ncbi:MAG: cold-shock protein [Cyclobacteriaceae bacterium]